MSGFNKKNLDPMLQLAACLTTVWNVNMCPGRLDVVACISFVFSVCIHLSLVWSCSDFLYIMRYIC